MMLLFLLEIFFLVNNISCLISACYFNNYQTSNFITGLIGFNHFKMIFFFNSADLTCSPEYLKSC